MRILFMGTPDFALASLKALVEAGHEVCAVFTQPDKPAKRGMKLTKSPVKLYAEEQGLPVYQPARVKGDPELVETVRALAPELGVAVAYGKLLPKEILEAPRHGFINVHGSLLPQYRGAAPIQWTVLNGEETAGVSTMYLCEEMDAGDVIDSRATPVGEGETYGELYERLKILGAALLLDTVRAIGEGTAARTPQDPALVSFAPPIRHEDRPVDWTQSAREIANHIHGLAPAPAATAELGGVSFKLYRARLTGRRTDRAPGSVVSQGKEGLEFACGDGETLLVTELQAPGGKRMAAADYLRGHKI